MIPCARSTCDRPAAYVPRLFLYAGAGGLPAMTDLRANRALCAAHQAEVRGPEDLYGPDYLTTLAHVFLKAGKAAPTRAVLEWERLL